jgi:hypothetical protein
MTILVSALAARCQLPPISMTILAHQPVRTSSSDELDTA